MANLIITIISIALVAVAALMGAYYGGTAFLEGQSKARVNALTSQATQIGGGLQAWWATSGRSNNYMPAWDGTASASLVPSYLTSIPTPPTGFADWHIVTKDGSNIIDSTENHTPVSEGADLGTIFALTTNNDPTMQGAAEKQTEKICNQLNQIHTGSSSIVTIPEPFAGGETDASVFGIARAICIIDDANDKFVLLFKI